MKHVRFHQHYITDGTIKARVYYSLDNRIDGRPCVTLYDKDYNRALGRILEDGYQNATDIMTDYFDKGHVDLYESSPYYKAARAAAEKRGEAVTARYAAKRAKWAQA